MVVINLSLDIRCLTVPLTKITQKIIADAATEIFFNFFLIHKYATEMHNYSRICITLADVNF